MAHVYRDSLFPGYELSLHGFCSGLDKRGEGIILTFYLAFDVLFVTVAARLRSFTTLGQYLTVFNVFVSI